MTDTTAADVSPEDAELLQTLLGFFDELATNNSEDLLAESAVAAQRAGDIYVSLGKLSQADKAYSDALGRYTSLSESESDNLSFIIARAEIMNELAVISSLRGNLARAHQLFQPTIPNCCKRLMQQWQHPRDNFSTQRQVACLRPSVREVAWMDLTSHSKVPALAVRSQSR